MKTRMERIYEAKDTDTDTGISRSSRNKENYKKIYEEEIYTNIEGTISTPKEDEIDLDKLKEIVLRREEEEDLKNHLVKQVREEENNSPVVEEEETKNYDIKEVLRQAKEGKETREDRYHSLDEEYLNDLKNPTKHVERIPMEEDIKEIKSLLNTLTSSMELKKLRDTEVALGMFDDLKETRPIDEDPIVKALIEETKAKEEKDEEDIDRTFDTTKMHLKVTDYTDDDEEDRKMKPALKFFLIMLVIAFLLFVGYIVYKMIMK